MNGGDVVEGEKDREMTGRKRREKEEWIETNKVER